MQKQETSVRNVDAACTQGDLRDRAAFLSSFWGIVNRGVRRMRVECGGYVTSHKI